MVIDTSILMAVILKENGFEDLVFKMAESDTRFLSAASYLEASIVLLGRRGKGVEADLDRLIYESEIVIIPVTAVHARIGRQAYLEYGKGMGHPAQLNLGDCFAYALSKQRGGAAAVQGWGLWANGCYGGLARDLSSSSALAYSPVRSERRRRSSSGRRSTMQIR